MTPILQTRKQPNRGKCLAQGHPSESVTEAEFVALPNSSPQVNAIRV